ncbi:hypothetical protein QJ856_gp1047 [Tupanvirus deep ocean]|uniref:Uncharacterized protein n=2 Tax=Tupanvirus TaxID=2094720 RepID=A0AC62A7F3_9VIRU|nr:hypothetical protein QJ856_gp1047 [Tupanvirus deep ocean]QKU33710.1 hypothetical protein [Tupanvirus deep ocean]
METQTITITFCEIAENHVGMEKLGIPTEVGFVLGDLLCAKKWFDERGATTELLDLNYPIENINIYPDDEAFLLIIREGVNYLFDNENANDLFDELISLNWDSKALMYGRVVNKNARHNLCFSNNNQDPNYESGKGRVISFNSVPLLKKIKNRLKQVLGDSGSGLVAEGNYYYDVSKCGIGYHGDSERKKVIGVRIGATIPLVYQWHHKGQSIGQKMIFELNHGDIYIMSEKATGNDWKKKNLFTLRHAAGCAKYTGLLN